MCGGSSFVYVVHWLCGDVCQNLCNNGPTSDTVTPLCHLLRVNEVLLSSDGAAWHYSSQGPCHRLHVAAMYRVGCTYVFQMCPCRCAVHAYGAWRPCQPYHAQCHAVLTCTCHIWRIWRSNLWRVPQLQQYEVQLECVTAQWHRCYYGRSEELQLCRESSQCLFGSWDYRLGCVEEDDCKIGEAGERENLCWWSVSGAARNETWRVDERMFQAHKSLNLSLACSRDEKWSDCAVWCADTLCASVHAVWVGVLFTTPVGYREVYIPATEIGPKLSEKSRIVRPRRLPRIPTSRRPIVTVPICWRGRMRQVSLWLWIKEPPAGSRID